MALHLIYPQFLDDSDPAQRNMGTRAGLELLSRCDELWACGTEISAGMQKEIQFANGLGVPVRQMEMVRQAGPALSL